MLLTQGYVCANITHTEAAVAWPGLLRRLLLVQALKRGAARWNVSMFIPNMVLCTSRLGLDRCAYGPASPLVDCSTVEMSSLSSVKGSSWQHRAGVTPQPICLWVCLSELQLAWG